MTMYDYLQVQLAQAFCLRLIITGGRCLNNLTPKPACVFLSFYWNQGTSKNALSTEGTEHR